MKAQIIAICLTLIFSLAVNAQVGENTNSYQTNALSFLKTKEKSLFANQDKSSTLDFKRFYVKTEVLTSSMILVFVRKAYYTDLQFGYALTQGLHINAGISRAKTYSFRESVAQNDPNVYGQLELEGILKLGYDLGLRIYPFKNQSTALDYLFAEVGGYFHPYSGNTYEHAYNTVSGLFEYQYEHMLEIQRYGPKLEIGLSYRDLPMEGYDSNSKVQFCPEILIGMRNVNLIVLKDEVNQLSGANEFEPYAESPLKLYLRGRIGISF